MDKPDDQFGKVMSNRVTTNPIYFHLATDVPGERIIEKNMWDGHQKREQPKKSEGDPGLKWFSVTMEKKRA